MPPDERSIIHVDMDAFYASVEQLDHPELRGMPVIVGGLGPRGVVSTCSYEARPFGVRSAMPTAQARRLCPDGVYLWPRMARYEEFSVRVFEVFHEVTPLVEGLSLDEAFLDVTASLRLLGSVEAIAQRIKHAIGERTGLVASVGMGPNKLLAKLASELSKPDGFRRITAERAQRELAPLPVGRLWTVGKVTEQALHRLGIRTIGELAACDTARLAGALGRQAGAMQALARGEDDRCVEAEQAEQSIGAEHTFDTDLAELSLAESWLLRHCERIAARARERGLSGRTVTVKLREPPFVTHTRQAQLCSPSASVRDIHEVARGLLETWWRAQRHPRLRLLGVSLSGFAERRQQDLFDPAPTARLPDEVQDRINAKFGSGSLVRAGVLRTHRQD
ncbi:DNA polymerase IV [Dyella solisilvae]|uniref:DNA polymerase IV n=1 Tax=Dyella solisilvae TaxID=1920168 RepID=A0A370K9Z8_9GAMM|nr:DNA polymerase IV [Dyella solisilvae]RDI99476.1 DNA polymerase IV [Dyella solisilvae]